MYISQFVVPCQCTLLNYIFYMYECHFYIPNAGNLPGIVRFYPLIGNVNSHDTIKRTKKTENLIDLTMNGYNSRYI